MKSLLKKIRSKKINKFARFSRKAYFKFFDLLGEMIFFTLRSLRIIPKTVYFEKDNIKKILIIRIDRIGDLILSTPAIKTVRESFPDAEISLMVREYTRELVVDNPYVDKVLTCEKEKVGNGYDLSISLHPGLKPNYLAFRSKARYRIGYIGSGGSFFLTHKIIDDREIRLRHEVESALEVVGSIGCVTKDKRLQISVTEEGEEFAERFFKENRLKENDLVIAIHPGARQEYIKWKKEGFASVADKLIEEERAKVILIGAGKEKRLVEEVASLMQNKPFFAVGLKLTQLVSLIKRCNLFIGNSSGPMHIAAALGIPVVAIFGNIHPLDSYQEWGPWGEGHVVISKNMKCPDCHPGDCKSLDCMKKITTDEVLDAAEKQLRTKQ